MGGIFEWQFVERAPVTTTHDNFRTEITRKIEGTFTQTDGPSEIRNLEAREDTQLTTLNPVTSLSTNKLE